MRSPRFRRGYVWIFCFVLSFLNGTSARGTQPNDKEIDRLRKVYWAAQTELERRAVCLEAIDKGVVARGRPVAVVDAIFGTSYAKELPRGREIKSGVVYFYQSPTQSIRDNVLAPLTGWYFVFKYDSAGRLEAYYLTNVYKK